MIRQNKIKIIISSILVLLPILTAFIFWDYIPDVLLTHWNSHGVADGQAKKNIVVFLFPVIMLVAHWVCILSLHFDKRNATQSNKIYNVVLWIFPVISNYISATIYLTSAGANITIISVTFILMSILFIVIGNYLPKCKQNTVIGVRIKWTLESEENWNATHRFTGKVWTLGGIIMLFTSLLPLKYLVIAFFVEMFLMIIIPIIYSYKYSKTVTGKKEYTDSISKKAKVISLIFVIVVIVLVLVILFIGDIKMDYGKNSFTVSAAWWQNLTVEYDVIESVCLEEGITPGIREFGLGSAKLLAGSFNNDKFGSYTLYSYTNAKTHVVIKTSKFGTLVISGKNADETLKIYNELNERV